MSHNSSAKVDQKEYLKKYLSGDKTKKKKKKDKKYDRDSYGKVRIIDDDAVAYKADSDDDLLLTGEDAPQIVGYIETESNKNGSNKWRSIADMKEEVQIKRERSPKNRWDKRSENRNIKNEYSTNRENRNNMSPPRTRERHVNPFKANCPDLSPARGRRDPSTDLSPSRSNPFKKNARGRSSSADLSPARGTYRKNLVKRRSKASSDDMSPPRLNPFRQGAHGNVPTRVMHSPRGQQSPQHQRRISIDLSPPRKRICSISPRRQQFSRNQSPSRRPQNPFAAKITGIRGSADLSPPRKEIRNSPQRERHRGAIERTNFERPENRRQNGASNDRYRSISSGSSSQRRRENSRQRNRSRSMERPQQSSFTARNQERTRFGNSQSRRCPNGRQNQRSPPRRRESDQSPPRRRFQSPAQKSDSPHFKREKRSPSYDRTKVRWGSERAPNHRDARRSRSDSPPPTHKPKVGKTLDGKKAGLQDAQALKEETAARRREEDRMFEKMSKELSGRDAEVAVRSTGRRGQRDRDARPEDVEKQRRKDERDKQKKEIYDRWGKGLKQVEDHRARLEEQAYESSKPLARYSNDADLEKHLRDQERVDDPMLAYMRRKKKEKLRDSSVPQKPVYEGSYPENRFGIRPGYRWDGVDRSNGYEKKWFDVQNAKRAGQEEAYKYSVEDM